MDADALYREHHERLRRYLFRLVGDLDAADDILQETFVRALERPPAALESPRAWLYRVATNLAHDRSRWTIRVRRLLARVDAGAIAPAPQAAERSEARERLDSALAALSARERQAILMREDGFTHREIADAIGTTTGTIGTLLARALRKLATAPALRELAE